MKICMSENETAFDNPLEFAATIPSSWYADSQMLELEKEKIFSRTWQFVGRADHALRRVNTSLRPSAMSL